MVRRRLACLLVCTSALSAAAVAPAAAGAASAGWRPVRLAREVVRANLKKTAPGFRSFLGATSCTGQVTVARCTVKASVSNDNVTAKVSFTRHRDGTHITYVDKLTFVAVMGSTKVTRTYYGKIIT